jgi:hypothetical protein
MPDEDARDLIGGAGASGPDIGWHSAFAAPCPQEPAAGFVLQSLVAANTELDGLNCFYRKSLLPTANST